METDNVIFCNNFNEIVDYYLKNFNTFQINKKTEFECEYGSIEFIKYSNPNKIIVHSIYIKKQYRRKGLATILFKHLLEYDEAESFKFVNTDDAYKPFKKFAESINLPPGLGQHEMILQI